MELHGLLHNKATIEQYLSRAGQPLDREREEDPVNSVEEAWAAKEIITSCAVSLCNWTTTSKYCWHIQYLEVENRPGADSLD